MTVTFIDTVSRETLLVATRADDVPREGDRVQLTLNTYIPEGQVPPTLAPEYNVAKVVWEFSGGLLFDYSPASNNLDRVRVYLDPVRFPY